MSTMKLPLALFLAAHALSAASQPMAPPVSQPSAPASADIHIFNQLDRNKDGVVTKDEAEKSATAKSEFNAIDRNRDGSLSREEWVEFFTRKDPAR